MYTHMKKMNVQTRVIAAAMVVLLLLSGIVPLSSARAESAEIQTGQVGTVTGDCTITLPEELAGKEYRITDGLVESYQTFEAGQSVQVDLPEGAQGLYLEWYNQTSDYTVTQTDQSGATLSEDAAQPFINTYYPLKEGVKSVTLSFSRECSLSTLAVYGAGELPSDVQRWNQPASADLLVVASTSKTALDEFFGVIATYACNHDIPTALVVMSRNTRSAQPSLPCHKLVTASGSTPYGQRIEYAILPDTLCQLRDCLRIKVFPRLIGIARNLTHANTPQRAILFAGNQC